MWDTCGETNRCEKPCLPQMPQGECLLKIATVVVMKVSLFAFEGYCRQYGTGVMIAIHDDILSRVSSSCAGDKLTRISGPVQNES